MLIEVCGHDPVQAEQCALIVHFRGSYEIKTGSEKMLTAMRRSLSTGGLTSEVSVRIT